MPRPQNPDLTKYWKICLPATIAGTVEFYLLDRLHNKPKYGSRGALLTRLLSDWIAEQKDPDARARAVLNELIPVINVQASNPQLLEAIKRGLEAELAPSPIPSLPSSISSLA